MMCIAWSRSDASSVGGSKAKYAELSVSTQRSLREQHHFDTTDNDDQPLCLIDKLKSTPAQPVDVVQRHQQPADQARYVRLSLNMI